jgi:hypothetical protein
MGRTYKMEEEFLMPNVNFESQLSLDKQMKQIQEMIMLVLTELATEGDLTRERAGIRILFMNAHGEIPGMHLMGPNPIGENYFSVLEKEEFKSLLYNLAKTKETEDGVIIVHLSGQVLGARLFLHERAIRLDSTAEKKILDLSEGGTASRTLMRWSLNPRIVSAFQLSEGGNVYMYDGGVREQVYSPKEKKELVS